MTQIISSIWTTDVVGENSSFLLYKPLFKLFCKEMVVHATQVATLQSQAGVTYSHLYLLPLSETSVAMKFSMWKKKGRHFYVWTPHATWCHRVSKISA